MEKLKSLLDSIYNTEHGMLYFYLILGVIALIFVVLIIITIIKAKKEDKILKEVEQNNPALKTEFTPEVKEEPQEEIKEETPLEETKEEIKEEPVKEEEPQIEPEYFSETQIFNKVLMDSENQNNNEDLTPSPIQNESLPLTMPEENNLKEEETNNSVYLELNDEEKSIGELFTEELPIVSENALNEPITEEELNTPIQEEKASEKEEKEEVVEIKEEPVKEEPKNLTDTQSIHISNDEIKARLAKLKNLKPKEETNVSLESSDTGLINIMSSAGIDDEIELPAVKAHNTEEIDTNKTI